MADDRERLLYEFVGLLRELSRMRSFFVIEGLTLEEFMVLDEVSESGPCVMRDIATALSLPPSTATGIVDRLVEKDYVRRRHSDRDRRRVIVELTPAGLSAYNKFRDRALAQVEDSVRHLSNGDLQALMKIIRKILDRAGERMQS